MKAAGTSSVASELLLRKLGPTGRGRVDDFRNFYSSGWGKHGKVLSPKAVEAFFRFLEIAHFPAGYPSVFLTDRGGIELCWEEGEGKSAQVEIQCALEVQVRELKLATQIP